jgi:hypothetical protein
VSPVEWGGDRPDDFDTLGNPPAQPPVPASGWPTRLAGYAKLIATAITTLGTTGVLQWLQSAGVTSLPAWAVAGITAVVGLLTVLFSPRNKL